MALSDDITARIGTEQIVDLTIFDGAAATAVVNTTLPRGTRERVMRPRYPPQQEGDDTERTTLP